MVLDKKSNEWSRAPVLVKFGLLAIKTRKTALAYEAGATVLALASVIGAIFEPPLLAGSLLFAASYWYAVSIRWVDNAGLWR